MGRTPWMVIAWALGGSQPALANACLNTPLAPIACDNTIRTLDTNGNLVLSPNGTGSVSMTKVAITGGTGLIGTRLVQRLSASGAKIRVLTRNVGKSDALFSGMTNVSSVPPSQLAQAIQGCTGVVNLAGEPIASRWDQRVKDEIVASRLRTTQKLTQIINALPKEERPRVLVSSSAIGFYGTSETASFDESSPAGNDFLAQLCVKWEVRRENEKP